MYRDKLLPLSVLFLGAGGCFLNHKLHTVGVDGDTLLLADTSYPMMLLAVSALVAVVMLLGVIKGHSHQGGAANLGSPSGLTKALWTLGATAMAVGAGQALAQCLLLMRQRSEGYYIPLPIVPSVGAVVSTVGAIGLLVTTKYLAKGECPPKLGIMATLLGFVPLPWLLHCYQENTRNPIVTLYGYQLLGLSAAAIALYLSATFFYGKSSPKKAAFFCLTGAYLLITSMGLHLPYYMCVNQAALAIVLLGNASAILKNMNIAPQMGSEQEGTE